VTSAIRAGLLSDGAKLVMLGIAAGVVMTLLQIRQNGVAVARPQAAARSPSICRSHPSSWFQLAKMRLTT